MTIEADIRAWDGKQIQVLEAVYERHCTRKQFISSVLRLLERVDCQKGASWLLKRHLENGNVLNAHEIKTVYQCLPGLEAWVSRLHILQCMPYLPIARADRKRVERFLRQNLMDQNKFIRAWTYNGYYELARAFPDYRQETRAFFEMAMRDEAPAVKSRIRNILKTGF